ncbi:MAG: bifunctional folylpolyglutamate synthase/dihydrofolate synthase [Ignavibacteriota bacterium]|nr:bifunctional folylpolyglutamate synthase/dihydrofolate synthase [Ignavibacteriota bacterium]MCO6446661.1 bifunctional folylpolyglutamate synthase/dihydrofolate synthase [Ignavibacterium album]MCZ2267659.1 bifunctional folylpolyglutamate synthase/dihydrofolate synthase [Ignavibacteriales bacterium]QKJ99061.1 MAG: bifunctional folylpolyglutamate synthase/dihydrofolate synthase [Ignavibacteriota bacterium]HOJ07010.1 folylpolyglutamate synthase/dihydrofolate synthase family protein [Ignavibacter
MDIQDSLNKLFALHQFDVKLGLDNITGFLDAIGNPQKKLKTIHIAGSNGKGSTASFIASILMESGYRTGLYTSPHFVKFNERISINGKLISDDYIANFIDRNQKKMDEYNLTFFEVTTAMAFEYFLFMGVDIAVIETGLGGRLDATNVLNPLACVITPLSLEHTNILGEDLEHIAFEKSEIIKPGCKTFIGLIPEEAIKIIERKVNSVKAELFCLEEYIVEKNNNIQLYTEEIQFDEWEVPLIGKHQKYNAALAALCIAKSFSIDDPSIIINGIKNVIKNTRIQGRYEIVLDKPRIILDSAHNPQGIESLINTFKTGKDNYKKSTLLFSVMKDKNIKQMLLSVRDIFDDICFYELSYERTASIETLKSIADSISLRYSVTNDLKFFLTQYISGPKENCLVAAGSMYLLGEVKPILSELLS